MYLTWLLQISSGELNIVTHLWLAMHVHIMQILNFSMFFQLGFHGAFI